MMFALLFFASAKQWNSAQNSEKDFRLGNLFFNHNSFSLFCAQPSRKSESGDKSRHEWFEIPGIVGIHVVPDPVPEGLLKDSPTNWCPVSSRNSESVDTIGFKTFVERVFPHKNISLALKNRWMSHVTHMNESCHTYEWVTSHISCLVCQCMASDSVESGKDVDSELRHRNLKKVLQHVHAYFLPAYVHAY